MNTSAEVLLKWADGEYTFRLRIKEIDELQRICGAGVGDIAMRVVHGRPYYRDMYDTIRLGLIGGGLAPVKAKELVDMYVDGRPIADLNDPSSPLATTMAIFNAIWFGLSDLADEDSTPKKEIAAAMMAGLTSPRSTAKRRTSGGRRNKRKS